LFEWGLTRKLIKTTLRGGQKASAHRQMLFDEFLPTYIDLLCIYVSLPTSDLLSLSNSPFDVPDIFSISTAHALDVKVSPTKNPYSSV
jgi:hypothetical protein